MTAAETATTTTTTRTSIKENMKKLWSNLLKSDDEGESGIIGRSEEKNRAGNRVMGNGATG